MKKKGLIISTVVMAVVLIASLTTATYAWFSQSAAAKVQDISFAVTSASDLKIGISKTNRIVASGDLSDAAFVSEGTQYAKVDGTWDGTPGLGLSVDTGLDLSGMTKAVYAFSDVAGNGDDVPYTGTVASYVTITDEGTTPIIAGTPNVTSGIKSTASTTILKAYGEDANGAITSGTLEATNPNGGIVESTPWDGDYLDVSFGVTANDATVAELGCLIGIQPTTEGTTLGMNAAIHVAYSINDTDWFEYDVYGKNAQSKVKTDMTAPTDPVSTLDGSKTLSSGITWKPGDTYLYVPIDKSASTSTALTKGQIYQIHIIIYICGPDADCKTSATGVGSTISINFLDLKTGDFTA